jgi:hypothetical protein
MLKNRMGRPHRHCECDGKVKDFALPGNQTPVIHFVASYFIE